jgi:hypothetical protein
MMLFHDLKTLDCTGCWSTLGTCERHDAMIHIATSAMYSEVMISKKPKKSKKSKRSLSVYPHHGHLVFDIRGVVLHSLISPLSPLSLPTEKSLRGRSGGWKWKWR